MKKFCEKFWVEIAMAIFGCSAFILLLNIESLIGVPKMELKDKLTSLTAIPLFVITVVHILWSIKKNREQNTQEAIRHIEEINRSHSHLMNEQRLNTIRDYIGNFHTNQYLQDIFFKLVYSYTTDIYKALIDVEEYKNLEPMDTKDPIFVEKIVVRNNNKQRSEEGCRFYHPNFMKTSLEEKRIDSLLGYFDVIGYYYNKGYLELEDIVGTVGFYLDTISNRPATREYIQFIHENWSSTGPGKRGCPEPYWHLVELMQAIASANQTSLNSEKADRKKRVGVT